MGSLHRTAGLVRLAVMLGNIRLGVAVDALFDRDLRRLVGVEVRCGDGNHRFLPLPACEVRGDRLTVESALVFLEGDLAFYRAGGRSFSELVGARVSLRAATAGTLVDLLVTDDGDVSRVVAASTDGRVELEPGAGVVVGNHGLRPAV